MMKVFRILVLFVAVCLNCSNAFSQGLERDDSISFQLSLWNPVQIASDEMSVVGLSMNLVYGENRNLYGIDMGLINRLTRDLDGAQAGLLNICCVRMRGVQVGLDNIVGGFAAFGSARSLSSQDRVNAYGLQIGAFNSVYPKGKMIGIQAGIINIADSISGAQIGIINCANDMTGIQMGLVNFNDNSEFSVMPVINARF